MAIASLILGIISLFLSAFSFGFLGLWGCILSILGIVFGILGRKEEDKKGMATAGLICSIVALSLGFVILFLFVFLFI